MPSQAIYYPQARHTCSHCGGWTTCAHTGTTVMVYAYATTTAAPAPDERPKNTPGGPPRRPVIEGRRPLPRYQAPRARAIRRAVARSAPT